MSMKTHDFADVADRFIERAHSEVWCNVATIDSQGRPRSRILHPIWEGETGWITSDPRSLKSRHLAHHPYVSVAYVKNHFTPVTADCHAEWVVDIETLQHVWGLVRTTPEPLGFDPATICPPIGEEVPNRPLFGVIKLTPYRITLYGFPQPPVIWTPGDEEQAAD
jgi:hypothetical protein